MWLENYEQSPQNHLMYYQWIKCQHRSKNVGISFLVSLSWGDNDMQRPQYASKCIHINLRAL